MSGGAGYVLSTEALRRFGGRSEGLCAGDGHLEDVDMGSCMKKLGVKTGDSKDDRGRLLFYSQNLDFYLKYNAFGQKTVSSCEFIYFIRISSAITWTYEL